MRSMLTRTDLANKKGTTRAVGHASSYAAVHFQKRERALQPTGDIERLLVGCRLSVADEEPTNTQCLVLLRMYE